MKNDKLGCQDVRWDLSVFYAGIDDPQIALDVGELKRQAKSFAAEFKGRLATRLGAAIAAMSEFDMLGNKVGCFLHLSQSLNANNERVRTINEGIGRRLADISGQYLTFYDLELAALPDEAIEAQKADPVVERHMPYIREARVWRKHQLTEEVESALAKRSPFGPGTWAEFYDVVEADLRFRFQGEDRTMGYMLDVVSHHQDGSVRARALKILNDKFKGPFAKYSAQTLNVIAGSKAVENRERGFGHPMSSRNLSNRIPDEVVEALHDAVRDTAGPLARRYYRLKAKHLGRKTLRWSDRNAPLPGGPDRRIPFPEALTMVEAAYRGLSPILGDLVAGFAKNRRIDAPCVENKDSGAYNMSFMVPPGRPSSFVLLNYQGKERDVMTLAHELGHGVHGLLAAEAQGALMMQAPTAYAETASVFGEMVVFEHLKARLARTGNDVAVLTLLMGKIDDFMNTVIRQISFSNFERRLHSANAAGQRLSVEDMCAVWLEVTRELYGPDGETFSYRDMDHLWSYVSHFQRPFYVYGYATGELFTQGIYAQRRTLGDRFEPLYLDLLRAGGTKGATELLAPFGLDPSRPAFWSDGIKASVGRWIELAEHLSRSLGIKIGT